MILFPAIDLIDGQVVRLSQGKFDQVTQYYKDPVDMAKELADAGSKWLHVVDLDGAKGGEPVNHKLVQKICQAVRIPVQIGGGIRKSEHVRMHLESGAQRVVLGTRVLLDDTWQKEFLPEFRTRLAVSLDCQNGFLTAQGWQKVTELKVTEFVAKLEEAGLETIIYTDVARDGMLAGPNYPALEELLDATSIPVIASGGISSLKDIERLKSLEGRGLVGAITGKAIYEKKFSLKDALAIC